MKKYICTVCGYIFDESDGVLWQDLGESWLCPLCGADKAAFEIQKESNESNEETITFNNQDRQLKEFEISALCSNLAKGCEKQYLTEEANAFKEIGKYYEENSKKDISISEDRLIEDMDQEINETFINSNAVIDSLKDRGSKRALVWSEKVTRMLKSILNKYEKEGDSYLQQSNVYVCEICGFLHIGDEKPEVCPVCKVPNFKLKEIGRD